MQRILWIRNLKGSSGAVEGRGGQPSCSRLRLACKTTLVAAVCCLAGFGWAASHAVAAPQAVAQQAEEVSAEAVMTSGLRGGALVPTHANGSAAHHRDMLEAMRLWNAHRWADGVERMHRVWQQSPESPWAAEAELHEACYLKFNCRYEESEERFLSVLKKYPDSAGVRKKVFYYLPHLYALTGRLDDAVEAQKVLGEYALNWQEQQFLENQLRVLSSAKQAQDKGRLCGVKALALAQAAAESRQPERGLRNISYKEIYETRSWALERSSHPEGYSIADLTRRGGGQARRISYDELRQLAKPGRPVIVYLDAPRQPRMYETLGRPRKTALPSLTGHFVVVERAEDGYLDALDPIKGRERWDACMFQARWSGIVLILPGTAGQHGRPLENGLAETLRGGCCGSPPPDPVGGVGGASSTGTGRNGPPTSVSGPGPTRGGSSPCGAPSYLFGLPTANLVVMDTPMWFPSANGPATSIQLVYNRINSGILSDTNTQSIINYYTFGNKWSFNYSSFVKVTPGGNIDVVMPDGLVLEYLPSLTPVDIRNRHTLSVEGAYYKLTLDGSRTSHYYSTNTASLAGQQVERIVDRFGHTLTMQYNASGQLTNIVDAVGRFLALRYNGGGYVTNITDMIGRSCSFGYSPNSNLVSMTDMGGYTTTLQYDSNNWVTNIVYPNSSYLHIEHTPASQLGSPYSSYSDANAFRMQVINSIGATNEYFYHSFDSMGPVTVTDGAGNSWLYGHSGVGDSEARAIYYDLVNAKPQPDNYVVGGDQWEHRSLDLEGYPIEAATATQAFSAVLGYFGQTGEYATDHFRRNFAYDTNHWMTSETWFMNNAQMAVWSNVYDSAGNRIYTRDPLGAVTRAVFNTNDLPISITNALGQVTSMQYDAHGNLTRLINPRLATNLWAYDARGLATNVTLPDNTTNWLTYDSIGRLITTTDPVGLTASNRYDNLDRITDVYYPDNTSTHYNFSCCGLDSVIDRLGRQTTYERDILKRVTNVVDAANQRVGFGYGPGGEVTRLAVWMDGAPRTTHFGYTSTNGFTRLTKRTSPLGKTTGYDYYFRGWLKNRTDGANRATQYQYDPIGRLKEIDYPGGTNVTMGYDAVGHVTSVANNNASSAFRYDLLGRLTNATVSLSVPGMTAVQYALEYQYDAAGNVTNRTLRGLSGFTQSVTNRYEYDAMNRLKLVTNALAWANYTYDKGRLATKSYGNGDTVSYGYDLESRLTNLTIRSGIGSTLQQFGYTYDAMGMMRSVSNAQQRIDYGYDAVYQLTSEVVNVSGTVTTNGWRYDSAGNLREIVQDTQHTLLAVNSDNELVGLGDTSSTQTALVDRIEVVGQVANSNKWYNSWASAKSQSAQVNRQDGGFIISNVAVSAGANALTVTVQDVSANLATQVVNFTVRSVTNRSQFTYDANGNLSGVASAVPSGNWTYGYDAENRLTTVTSNGVAVLQCWYDGTGHRVAKREIISGQTNTVQYVWDGWNLIAVLGADGQLQEYYTRGVGIAGDIGSLIAVTSYVSGTPSATRYLHNNHRGDVIMARQGVTVARLDYTPYGRLRSQIGSYTPRFLFSSKEYDVSTGFYHFPYRYYAPMWAKWLSREPIGAARSDLDLYRYVGNAALQRIDPLGLWYIDINVSAGFGLGVTAGVMIGSSGVHPYLGGGVMTPGISPSINWSGSNPCPGQWSGQVALVAGISYATGADLHHIQDDFNFREVGVGWPPGISGTAYYTW